MPTARAPSWAARSAISAPKPVPAPVTTTERPSKRRGMGRGASGTAMCPLLSSGSVGGRSDEGASAVDVEALPGDEAGPLGEQIGDSVRDLVGAAQATRRDERLELLAVPV